MKKQSFLIEKQGLKLQKLFFPASKYINKTTKNTTHLKSNSFLEQILESLSLYTNKNYNVIITFQNVNEELSLNSTKAKFLKKKLLEFRRESRNKFFVETVNILVISAIRKNSAYLLAEFIAQQLSTIKRHNFFLIFVKRFLNTLIAERSFSNISGIKFTIKGRFNGAPRARKRIYESGNIPIETINSNINYHQATSYTPNGTFGVKVWICEK